MFGNTEIFPDLPRATTGQSLVSRARLNVLISFIDSVEGDIGDYFAAPACRRRWSFRVDPAKRSPHGGVRYTRRSDCATSARTVSGARRHSAMSSRSAA